MRHSFGACVVLASVAEAVFPGDIVQYWTDQTIAILNGTAVGLGGLPSATTGWVPAIVSGAMYLAANSAREQPLEHQQAAVSHAAHNALTWVFHGTRAYSTTDAALRTALAAIGGDDAKPHSAATATGRKAAARVVTARSDDGWNDYIDYVYSKPDLGVYQVAPGANPFPDTPQAQTVRLFAAVGDLGQFKPGFPPAATSKEFEAFLTEVMDVGEKHSTSRKDYDTQSAYFWKEPSPTLWTRIASGVVGDTFAKDVVGSAKFYAQFYYALANAGIAAFHTKYVFNHWLPITAIRHEANYLASGKNVSNETWTPLLDNPSHQDYVSSHATFGAAAAEVLRRYLGKDEVSITVTSNVTTDNIGPITRTFKSLKEAAEENAASRTFAGLHFKFTGSAGLKLGEEVATATLAKFDQNWDKF